jgi:hypothetical protein
MKVTQHLNIWEIKIKKKDRKRETKQALTLS